MKQVIETALYASPEALFKLLVRKRAWLLDADDTTWISERFAFQGCTTVANRYLSSFGRPDVQFTATELMNAYRGRNARAIFQQLAVDYRLPITDDKLASLVAEELDAAIAELSEHCVAAPGVVPVLQGLHRAEKVVAMVSSSALKRLHACLDKTKLWEFFPFIYSAVDSLPVPTSKPKPDIYLHALWDMGMGADQSVAFEDGTSGVESSVNAGIDVVGYVGLVPVEEQDAHARVLLGAGAKLVFRDWAADIQPVVDYLNGGM